MRQEDTTLSNPLTTDPHHEGGSEIKEKIEEAVNRTIKEGQHKQKAGWIIAQVLCSLAGGASGGAWLDSAEDAANATEDFLYNTTGESIYENHANKTFIYYFFMVGTIITVGCDGSWIMNEVVKMIKRRLSVGFEEKKACFPKVGIPIFTVVLGILSCTASSYAIAKYNKGLDKLWLIDILPVHIGYGIYGYNSFLARLTQLVRDCRGKKSSTSYKNDFIRRLEILSRDTDNLSFSNKGIFESPRTFINYVSQIELPRTKKSHLPLEIIRYLLVAVLPLAASLVSVLLTYEAYSNVWQNFTGSVLPVDEYEKVCNQTAFSGTMTALSEFPNYILQVVSTYELLGIMTAIVVGMFSRNSSSLSPIRQFYKWPLIGLFLPTLFVSLAAPSPGGYITYNELSTYNYWGAGNFTPQESQDHQEILSISALVGLSAVIAARIILAAFTMTRWIEASFRIPMKYCSKEKGSRKSEALRLSDRIGELAQTLRGTEPKAVEDALIDISSSTL